MRALKADPTHTQAKGGRTTIGCLYTYDHGKGPHSLTREREKDTTGHVQNESKAKEIERKSPYLKTSKSPLFNYIMSSGEIFYAPSAILKHDL